MSKFPSLPLFTDAFIADTGHLNAQETGAYLLLIMMAWRTPDCQLPDDDEKLARWARVDRRTWLRIKPAVMEFWIIRSGFWSQKRLSKEWEIVSKRADAARMNGKQGGRPKSLTNNDIANPAGSGSLAQREAPNPNPIESPEAPKAAEPEGFPEFRSAYPKRNTAFPTTQARKRWLEARKRGAEPAEIIAGAKAYAVEQTRIGKVGSEYIQTADAWLNRQRWRDYTEAEPPPKPPATVPDEMWRERVRSWRSRGGYWPWQPCMPPNDPRTAVPRHILDEFGISINQIEAPPDLRIARN